jgi:DNA-binding NtrC family response regulator
MILRALEETGWNVTHAAKKLQISRKSLQIKMKEMGLREEAPPSASGSGSSLPPSGSKP